ncbi:hypothetical protein DID75_05595, partial [Candidatus Marinamargulisbacteria bacterium SCGC AG-410-N11]
LTGCGVEPNQKVVLDLTSSTTSGQQESSNIDSTGSNVETGLQSSVIRMGYVNELRKGGVSAISNINYSAVDYIIQGFLRPTMAGELTNLGSFESYRDELVKHSHQNNTKIIMSIGGAYPEDMKTAFAHIASQPELRQTFSENIISYITDHGYDGVDIDYEFPENEKQRQDFTLLMKSVYEHVKSHNSDLVVLFGCSPGYKIDMYQWEALSDYVDYAFLFGYDWKNPANGTISNPGNKQWTIGNNTIEASVRGAIHYIDRHGFPLDKLIVGLPFYSSNNQSWFSVQEAWTSNQNLFKTDSLSLESSFNGAWWTTPTDIYRKMDALLATSTSVLNNNKTVKGIGFWEFGHEDQTNPLLSDAIKQWIPGKGNLVQSVTDDSIGTVTNEEPTTDSESDSGSETTPSRELNDITVVNHKELPNQLDLVIKVWNGNIIYQIGDYVSYNGAIYQATKKTIKNPQRDWAPDYRWEYWKQVDAKQVQTASTDISSESSQPSVPEETAPNSDIATDTDTPNTVSYKSNEQIKAWDETISYSKGAIVLYNGIFYQAKQDTPINKWWTPDQTWQYWLVVELNDIETSDKNSLHSDVTGSDDGPESGTNNDVTDSNSGSTNIDKSSKDLSGEDSNSEDLANEITKSIQNWDQTKSYIKGSIVLYKERYYKAINDTPINKWWTPNETYHLWEQVPLDSLSLGSNASDSTDQDSLGQDSTDDTSKDISSNGPNEILIQDIIINGVQPGTLYSDVVNITVEPQQNVTFTATLNDDDYVLGSDYRRNGVSFLNVTATHISGETVTKSLYFTIGSAHTEGQKRVVGYFIAWGVYARNFHVADIPEGVTHLNYAFANIKNGEIVLGDSYADMDKMYSGMKWDDPIKGSFGELIKYKQKNPHVKTLISVGGWTWSQHFSDVALTNESRVKFAKSCIEFIKTWQFDGVDIDWEYPVKGGLGTNKYRLEDKQNYTLLMQEIRDQLNELSAITGQTYYLTMATAAGRDKAVNLDLGKLANIVDWINVMTYDFHGAWDSHTNHNAPLYPNPNSPSSFGLEYGYTVSEAIELYLQSVPANKIHLGLGFYGRSTKGFNNGVSKHYSGEGLFKPFTASGQNNNRLGPGSWVDWSGGLGSLDYKDIKDNYVNKNGYQYFWDDFGKVPYLVNPEKNVFVSYDNPRSIGLKVQFAKEKDLGGVMIWELSQDSMDHEMMTTILKNL